MKQKAAITRRKNLAQKRGNILQADLSGLMQDWDYEANEKMGFLPEEMTVNSNIRVNWKCHICGYTWQTSVAHRFIENTGCAGCSQKVFIKGKNDLATVAPELIEEWCKDKNGIDAHNIIASSSNNYWWKCRICGNTWMASPHNRVAGTNCPACQGHSTSFSEQAIFYYIKKHYANAVNRYIDDETRLEIDIYIPSKNIGIEYDGYYYHKDKRQQDDAKTKRLENKGIRLIRVREISDKGDYLPNLHTEPYLTLWHDRRDVYKNLDKIIKQILLNIKSDADGEIVINTKKDRFIILHTAYQGRKELSFGKSGSEHLQYWDVEKNNPLSPMDILPKSHISVYWSCKKCGGKWERGVNAQLRTKGCPYCNRQRVSLDYNLQALYPEIATEWDFQKNILSPSEIMPRSQKKYWWICSMCGNVYQKSPADRVNGSGCRNCGFLRISASRKKAVLQIDTNSRNIIREFPSARDAFNALGISYKGISACCNGKKKTCGGYIWKFKN